MSDHPAIDIDRLRAELEAAGFGCRGVEIASIEGYEPLGRFGVRAGPVESRENLAHEMAHAIVHRREGEGWRLKHFGFGLGIKTEVEIMGQVYQEPVTGEATARECRVVGTQRHLLEQLDPGFDGERLTREMAATLQRFMPDWVHNGGLGEKGLRQRIALIDEGYVRARSEDIRTEWARVVSDLQALRHEPREEADPSPG